MVKQIAEFLAGAAVITTPQLGVPLLVGAASLKAGHALTKRVRRKRPATELPTNGEDSAEKVSLEWGRLSVAITNMKTGKRQQIFKDLSGTAKPGR